MATKRIKYEAYTDASLDVAYPKYNLFLRIRDHLKPYFSIPVEKISPNEERQMKNTPHYSFTETYYNQYI